MLIGFASQLSQFTQESAETLQELWCSYNQISSLDGVDCLKNLEVLYMSNNTLSNWAELDKLKGLNKLRDVLFVGNPIYEGMDSSTRRYPCPF
jgi:dynein light chain 1